MRYQIEQFYKPESPVPISNVKLNFEDWDIGSVVSESDSKLTRWHWNNVILKKNPNATSSPRGNPILRSAANLGDSSFGFGTLEYAFYLSTSNYSEGDKEKRPLSPALYEQMRLVAVGAALHTIDEKVLVHQRSANATHSPNRIDSSFAGASRFYTPGKFELDLEKDLYRRMDAEVPIGKENVTSVGLIGVHSSEAPDFSGYFAFKVDTNLESGKVDEIIRAKGKGDFKEYKFVPSNELGDYVVRELCDTRNMVGDGAAVLLPSLSHGEFISRVDEINQKSIDWKFGRLENGLFVPN